MCAIAWNRSAQKAARPQDRPETGLESLLAHAAQPAVLPAGTAESNFLNNHMGLYLSGSFVLFIVSIAIWALKVFLFLMFLCRTLAGIVLVPACMLPVVVVIFTTFFGSPRALCYRVHTHTHTHTRTHTHTHTHTPAG